MFQLTGGRRPLIGRHAAYPGTGDRSQQWCRRRCMASTADHLSSLALGVPVTLQDRPPTAGLRCDPGNALPATVTVGQGGAAGGPITPAEAAGDLTLLRHSLSSPPRRDHPETPTCVPVPWHPSAIVPHRHPNGSRVAPLRTRPSDASVGTSRGRPDDPEPPWGSASGDCDACPLRTPSTASTTVRSRPLCVIQGLQQATCGAWTAPPKRRWRCGAQTR